MLAVLAACGEGSTSSPATRGLHFGDKLPTGMTVTSSAFADGRPVPPTYTCEGDSVPPPLHWSGVPQAAAEIAVDVVDPDATSGSFVHWVATGVPPTTMTIGTGAPAVATLHEYRGSSDGPGYTGPCPPDRDGVHHYVFEVLALREHIELPDDLAPMQKVERLRASATAGGRIIGTFGR